MFFIAGVHPKRVELDYHEPILCKCCSKYGRYEVYMEYYEVTLFFLPFLKYGKKYFVRTTCCNTIYQIINKEKGLMIERGQGHNVSLLDEDMELIQKSYLNYSNQCSNCGYEIDSKYKFCPNCGKNLN